MWRQLKADVLEDATGGARYCMYMLWRERYVQHGGMKIKKKKKKKLVKKNRAWKQKMPRKIVMNRGK